MSDLDKARHDPEALLWKELRTVHAGMLGVIGSGQLKQPMAHYADREARALRFLTKRDTDLAQVVGAGARAEFVFIGKDQDFHCAMEGPIRQAMDRAKLDAIWGPVSGAWFQGKDDPDLVMLELRPERAAIWASTGSSLAFAWEIAKANATDHEPHVGVRREVEFV